MSADQGQRTEQPTPRRREKARQQGQVAASRDLLAAWQFALFSILLVEFGRESLFGVRQILAGWLRSAPTGELTSVRLTWMLTHGLLPLWAGLAAGGLLLWLGTLSGQLLLTRGSIAPQRLRPDLGRLNPLRRLQTFWSEHTISAGRSLVVLVLAAGLGWRFWRAWGLQLITLPRSAVASSAELSGSALASVLREGAELLLALGLLDYLWQRYRMASSLRMTKQEVREEAKESEGNPETKARVRRIQRELRGRRMMQDVAKATAVIVNPTHYAVAVQYQAGDLGAPRVIAKGRNYLAQRIRDRAREFQIPIVENAPLAQVLYKVVDVGQEIPPHLYRAVAEILAYLYRVMQGRTPGG